MTNAPLEPEQPSFDKRDLDWSLAGWIEGSPNPGWGSAISEMLQTAEAMGQLEAKPLVSKRQKQAKFAHRQGLP